MCSTSAMRQTKSASACGGIHHVWTIQGWMSFFLNACRTVSLLRVSTNPRTTSSSASSCNVQWQRPWGGSLQANCTKCCSTSPLILTFSGRGGCGLGWRAMSRPAVTNRLRIRSTLRRLVPKAGTIWSSRYANSWDVSASKRIRAWVSLRAAARPTATNFSKAYRSSAVKVTRYFSMAGFLLLGQSVLRQPHETESCLTRQSKIDTALGPVRYAPGALGALVPSMVVDSTSAHPVFLMDKLSYRQVSSFRERSTGRSALDLYASE